jgi:hypothetical protein
VSFSAIIYGPDSEPYNIYAVVSPAPGDNGPGGQIAQRGVHPLGQQLVLADGRKFRFTLGGVLMVPGDCIQGAAALTTSENLAPDADQAVGDRILTFTHGGATTVINLYAEGYATMSQTPGGGDCYKIGSHLALTNATAGDVVNFAPGNALRRAITTAATKIDLVRHPYAGALESPNATATGVALGVAVSAIASGGTGWLQTRGACGVLCEGTSVHGDRVAIPAQNDAGAAEIILDAAHVKRTPIGSVLAAAADTLWSTVFLTIDG